MPDKKPQKQSKQAEKPVRRIDLRAAVRSLNEFLHGSPDEVHSSRHGWLDPHDRHDKQFLDP